MKNKKHSKSMMMSVFVVKGIKSFYVKWSWRDSNPRPNKQYIRFLHAYFAIDFRAQAESKHPT